MSAGSGTKVYMDVPAVRGMASTFGTVSDVLATVAQVLDTLADLLKASAFIGMVGNAALAEAIEQVIPWIKQIGEKCGELDKDLVASANAYEAGDEEGATRFH